LKQGEGAANQLANSPCFVILLRAQGRLLAEQEYLPDLCEIFLTSAFDVRIRTFCPLIAGVSLNGREGLVESTLMFSTLVEIDKCRRYQMLNYVEPYQPFSWTLTLCDPWAVVVEEFFSSFLVTLRDHLAGNSFWQRLVAHGECYYKKVIRV
jgi:hypothetical protein